MSENTANGENVSDGSIDRSQPYDLKHELGRVNDPDSIAMEAQVVGTYVREPSLVSAGTELAHLISTIPYDHDRFYKVIAKSEDIRKQIEKRRLVSEEILENPTAVESDRSFSFRLSHFGGVYQQKSLDTGIGNAGMHAIVVDAWKAYDEFSDADTGRPLGKAIIEYLKTVNSYDEASVETNEYTTRYETENKELLYKNAAGDPTFLYIEHIHETGHIGRMWVSYFKDPSKLKEAWEGLRKTVVQAKPIEES